ncbi:hypothetical protein ACWDE0_21760 [Streptomyces sp. 900105755]
MGLTVSSKSAIGTAAGVVLAGFAVIVQSIPHDRVAGSIAGACLVMLGLAGLILAFGRHWIVNTSEERRLLAVSQRQADDRRTMYIAAQAALENEQGRLNRDVAAERARNAATLKAERERMRREFEASRAQEIADAFRTGAEMERAGLLKPGKTPAGNLIRFPKQEHQAAPERATGRERARERGVIGP